MDTPDGPLVHAIKLRDQDVIRHISFFLNDKPENMIEIIKRGNEVFKSMLASTICLDCTNEKVIVYVYEQRLG